MKLAPRRSENAVAKILTEYFAKLGMSPVERVPVIGRKGPDISINEFGLVVDVKARAGLPVFLNEAHKYPLICTGSLIGASLNNIDNLASYPVPEIKEFPMSKTLMRHWEHMDEWTDKHVPHGISALVVRRTGEKQKRGMDYNHSVLLIHKDDLVSFRSRSSSA